MGISHLKDKYYTEISGGERQLVLITSALCQEAKMIILDEPTSHLDFGNSYKFVEKMIDLNKEKGIGMLMILHSPDHALQLGGKSILFYGGSILDYGESSKVLSKENLSIVYNIRLTIEKIEGKKICRVL